MREVFLEAILNEPDEVSHRLVYADWLDEHGEPEYGEFIHLQCERAGLHPGEPRARALLERERLLLQRHEPAWIGRVADWAMRWGFRRGFIEEVTVSVEQFLAHGADLFAHFPIRRVQLRGVNQLPGLLSHSARAPGAFADLLCRLRELDLAGEYRGDNAGAALQALPRLPKLEALDLTRCGLSAPGVFALADSPVLDSLIDLTFSSSSAGLDGLQALLASSRLGNLRRLSLDGSALKEVRVLNPGLLGRLRALSLGHNNLGPA